MGTGIAVPVHTAPLKKRDTVEGEDYDALAAAQGARRATEAPMLVSNLRTCCRDKSTATIALLTKRPGALAVRYARGAGHTNHW